MYKLITILLFSFNIVAQPTLKFGATEWCPYTCSKMKNQGVATQYLREVFKKLGYNIEVKILPWQRAISLVSKSHLDGLLTAVESEAPKLLFTQEPTMSYRSCAFSTSEDSKKLTFQSIKKYQIGVLAGYSYGVEFDEFFSKNPKSIQTIKGSNGLNRLYQLTEKKRLDFFIEEEKVAKYSLMKPIYPVLCAKENPFYIGFNPKVHNVKSIINKLNLTLIETIKRREEILIEYNLK